MSKMTINCRFLLVIRIALCDNNINHLDDGSDSEEVNIDEPNEDDESQTAKGIEESSTPKKMSPEQCNSSKV